MYFLLTVFQHVFFYYQPDYLFINNFFNIVRQMKKLEIEEMGRMNKEQFAQSVKLPLTIVFDNVRSMYNIGSVFRTADAFRLEKIILCGISATPETNNTEIHKTALGAEETVLWSYCSDTFSAVSDLKGQGYVIVSLEQVHDSISLDSFVPSEKHKYALVIGNEVHGVDQKVVDTSDFSLEIPQFGTKHSLNVSVSAGIAIWEFARKLKNMLD